MIRACAVGARVRASRGADRRSFSQEMDALSRRMEKLAAGLEITEEELRRALAQKGFDPGVASLYRTVQGLEEEETDQELKRAMMSKIFEANLELREKRGEVG